MVDSVPNLHPINKFIYLKESLVGPLLNLIKNLPLLESNYVTAINLFSKEYNDNNVVVKKLFSQLLALRLCDNSLKDLRPFLDEVFQILSQLETLTIVNIRNILVIIEKKVSFWITEKLVQQEYLNTTLDIDSILGCLRTSIKIKEQSYKIRYDSVN